MIRCGSCTTPIVLVEDGFIHFWSLDKYCFPDELHVNIDVAYPMGLPTKILTRKA